MKSAVLYLGAVVPDEPAYWNPATSRAGNLFQTNFLNALRGSVLEPTEVVCYRPMPSFPRAPLAITGSQATVAGFKTRFLPMVNLGPLKILTVGLAAAWSVLRWARRHPDQERVVLAYNLNCPPAWPVLWACRVTKSRFAAFIGDIYVPGEVIPKTWFRDVEFGLQIDAVSRLDHLLVANWAIRDDFAPDREALLIEGGVPEAFLSRFKPRATSGPLHLVYAGGLTPLNGVDLLAGALALRPGLDVRVTVAGDGPLRPVAEALAARDSRVTYVGGVRHEQVLDLYDNADVVLSLRRTDSRTQRYVFPSKVVECLATGRPLLTTLTGHVESEFGGFVFPLRDETAEGVADALDRLVTSTAAERQRMGRDAQAYVRANKTWEAHVRRLEEFILKPSIREEKQAA